MIELLLFILWLVIIFYINLSSSRRLMRPFMPGFMEHQKQKWFKECEERRKKRIEDFKKSGRRELGMAARAMGEGK